MIRSRALAALLTVSVLLGGCELATAVTGRGVSATTDRDTYLIEDLSPDPAYQRYQLNIELAVKNTGRSMLYLARCYPDSAGPIFDIELLAPADDWGAAYNVAWGCVGHHQPLQIVPGETLTFPLDLHGPTAADGQGRPLGRLTGRMRVRLTRQDCSDSGTCRDVDSIRTNTFQVSLLEPPSEN